MTYRTSFEAEGEIVEDGELLMKICLPDGVQKDSVQVQKGETGESYLSMRVEGPVGSWVKPRSLEQVQATIVLPVASRLKGVQRGRVRQVAPGETFTVGSGERSQ